MMELGYGDQDLIYEAEAKRLAESAPVPRPMCLTCSKRLAEASMLQCPLADPLSKCSQCAEDNKPCHVVPSQFRGDLERIQALARESHVRPSKPVSKLLQEAVKKYVTEVETYERKKPTSERYQPYQVPRPTPPPPVPIPSPGCATPTATPMNSPAYAEGTVIASAQDVQNINRMLNNIAELLAERVDLPPEEEDSVGKDFVAAWLTGNGNTTNEGRINEAVKQKR
ncbi:uncharacterized protein GIQ15_00511 [Arthroderma uncinatum]|uniref:uncharacterized protein n=1 Tax=Arthroderma uncinatum TaxID=74035 RepID=UPI00144AA9B7|nr:uncharacterized protein GIQ15_00511 [Arthroderma uncinatum]KAF3490994.1 hypothetical protein GIQ15_00511 [Arthroderma uncinatum]